jgi:DNA-binding CsgD family transcriptional regulator
MVAHVIPIRLSARDIFVRCFGVLALTPITRPQAPPGELVQSLFDLTPAEARVARSLATGKTVEAIATEGSVSLNTVRTHVRHVLAKTGRTPIRSCRTVDRDHSTADSGLKLRVNRPAALRCATVLAMTPVAPPQAPPVELVQSLFDLTPAEARVARSLAAGKTVENIASDASVSLNTVRTHMRGVLEKTGCNRQTEVVALLTGIVPPRPAVPPS